MDYSGLGSGSHSIDFELEARLENESFESVFSESFEVSGDSGTVNESKLSTSFPVDLLAETSMSSSDFNEPNAGDTNVTTVDLRVSFSWSDSEYSASDSATSSFDVSVENTSPTYSVIDEFADGNINEYGGTTSDFSVNSDGSASGGYVLTADSSGADFTTWITSTSGLDNYPSQGDTIKVRAKGTSNGSNPRPGFILGAQDSSSGYIFVTHWNNQELKIIKLDGGRTTLSTSNANWPEDEWMTWEIEWKTDGTMIFDVYDSSGSHVSQATATDNTFTSGGIGWQNAKNDIEVYDYAKVQN